MEIGRRDAFDLALVAVGLMCVYSYAVDPSGPETAIGEVIDAILEIPTVVYLVAVGASGILLLSYLILYLPRKQYQ